MNFTKYSYSSFHLTNCTIFLYLDPPYGIREKKESCDDPPLVQLVKCIAKDRVNDKRLLKIGGRLVAFVPNVKGEDVMLGMPSNDELIEAGEI